MTAGGPLRPPKTRTLVVRVRDFEPDSTLDGCYPGRINATVAGGQFNGSDVRVSILETPTNINTRKVADLSRNGNPSFTPTGGYLSLSGAYFSGSDVYASWAGRFAGPEDEMRIGLPIQISPALDAEGNPRHYRSNSATVYNVSVLHVPELVTARSHGDLFKAVSDCFLDNRAAMLAYTDRSSGAVKRTTHMVWRGWRDGAPMPLDEAVLKVFSEPLHSKLEEAIQVCGSMEVIPIEPLRVGPLTAESIDQGRRNHVMMDAYSCGGLGGRIATALYQVGGEKAEAVNRAFLAGLYQNKKENFGRDGWKAMWNSDIKKFFSGLGQQLPVVPRTGFAISTAVLKPYRQKNNGRQEYFLARSRVLGPPVPRDAVATPSDPEAARRFFQEFRDIVENSARILMHGPEREPAVENTTLRRDDTMLEAGFSEPRNRTHPIESGFLSPAESEPGQ